MTRSVLSRVPAALVAACLGLALTACATRSINDILADPSRYANRDVTVKGEVTQSVSVLGHGSYKIEDGGGSLWVVSTKGVPRKGARVKVTGKIRDVADLGSVLKLPDVVGSGLVMTESSHKASY
jgi:membrane protein implicated in regulation of membrane protease activity